MLELVTLILVIALLVLLWNYIRIKGEIEYRARILFNTWRTRELEREANERARILLEKWKLEVEKEIREDAIKRSMATILGRIGEQLAPIILFSNYGIEPKDIRFLGTPIDFIAFKGLHKGELEQVIFIEVKSGKTTTLTKTEKAIKELIETGKVSWLLLHIPEEIKKIETKIT